MDLFGSGGEAGALMRELDWSANPLGPPEQWPAPLRAVIPIMLASRFAMRVLWGPELIFLYNDSYRPVLGTSKHPTAMGSRTQDSFAEVWHIVGPLFHRVYAGEAVALEDSLLPLSRHGYLEECYFTLSYSPIRGEDGAVGGVLGVVHETTDRVLAERRLRTLRELYAATTATSVAETCHALAGALEKNPFDVPFALLYVVDDDGKMARLAEAVGILATSPLAATDVPTDGSGVWAFARQREIVSLGAWAPLDAGAYAEAIATAIISPLYRPNVSHPFGYLVCGVNPRRALDEPHSTFFDLATQQIAGSLAKAMFDEERASLIARERAAEERLRTLFESAPAAIAVVRGPDHIFELANPLYCELVGRSDLIGRAGREALPELSAQGTWDRFDHVLATGVPFIGREFPLELARVTTAVLDPGYFNFVVQPMRDVDGTIRGLMIFAIEITELVKARADAERSNTMKDEFIAMVSHELRNPLSAILGWTHMLRTAQLTEDKQRRALETIERNALNQSQLIEDLLDVSRIVTGKLKLEVTPVNFVEVLQAAIDSARPALDAKQLRLRTVFDDAAVNLMGDAARLQQVVWNLLTNATKFTPKGGTISIVLARIHSTLELSVIDTGKGIAAEFVPFVFERFKQADSTSTRKFGGLGIGLAIVKSIVEMHGGTVSASSEGEGTGSTFRVRLPVSPVRVATQTAPLRPAEAKWEAPPELEGLRVLVVDDDEDGREMVAAILERCGSIVTQAASVAEALTLFEHDRPDVIVSDIGMPEQDGYALIKQIRARVPSAGGNTPAASLTAYAGIEDRRRALLAGFNMHVPKPVDPAELVAVVTSLGRFARAIRA